MDQIGLFKLLCHAPLLQHLETDMVSCSVSRFELFPTELGIRNSESGVETPVRCGVARLSETWTCSELLSLSLYFTQKPNNPWDGYDSRLVFGYLLRVCPKLKQLYIGFEDLDLDLQSGMCLLMRMDILETVTMTIHGRLSQSWRKGQDWSWMNRQDPTPWRKMTRVQEEETIILQRELFLKDVDELCKDEEQKRSRGLDFAHLLSCLGALTDVGNCLKEMASKRKHQR